MKKTFFPRCLLLGLASVCLILLPTWATADDTTSAEAWKQLPGYEYGQDIKPLWAVGNDVIQSMKSDDQRRACAARLAGVLTNEKATLAAKQFACLQLRQIGTPAEVPVLTRMLDNPKTSQMARYALQSIAGDEATAALRTALDRLEGQPLLGVIESVAARKDAQSTDRLIALAGSDDQATAEAALRALGRLDNEKADRFVLDRFNQAKSPVPTTIAEVALCVAERLAADGKKADAVRVYEKLGQPAQSRTLRRAGLVGQLRLSENQLATIRDWLASDDSNRWSIAAEAINRLSAEQVVSLLDGYETASNQTKIALIQALLARDNPAVLPLLRRAIQSSDPQLRSAGIRGLDRLPTSEVLPQLVETLLDDDPHFSRAAVDVLCELPKEPTGKALLEVIVSKQKNRFRVLDVLAVSKYTPAIGPLLVEAQSNDPAVFQPILKCLVKITAPSKNNLSRFVDLFLKTQPGKHRDAVERALLRVCRKADSKIDRAELILNNAPADADQTILLPLLGRLGSPKAARAVEASLSSDNPKIQEAAVRALCNWPNASVADRLEKIATESDQPSHQRWALRAYIRVISLKSNRPQAETLAMLKRAMKLCQQDEDRRLIVVRASTVRTMETVRWVAPYLDQPELAQAACRSIVDLAHHKFLRNPNRAEFNPLLKKVAQIGQDQKIVDRAKQYLLGM